MGVGTSDTKMNKIPPPYLYDGREETFKIEIFHFSMLPIPEIDPKVKKSREVSPSR